MKRALATVASLSLVLFGCPDQGNKVANTPHPPDQAVHVVGEPAPTEQVKPKSPPLDAGIAEAVADAGRAPIMGPPAEVEVSGNIYGVTKDMKLHVYVAKAPCSVDSPEITIWGSQMVALSPLSKEAHLGMEIFVPQGSVGYLCVYAVENGKFVGFGKRDNAMLMQGQGEVVFAGQDITLTKVEGKPLPKGVTP